MKRSGATRASRGAATLALAAALLLLSTLLALFSQHRLWFEQKASANQTRAIEAAELAQAGLEWAIAQLNMPAALAPAPSCDRATPAQEGESFRERYVAPHAATPTSASGFLPPARSSAGCQLAGSGALTCTCPAPGPTPSLASPETGHFVVEFLPHAQEPQTIEVRSTGHARGDDATAQVRQLLKLSPSLVHPPDAAVVVGGDLESAGAVNIVHEDTALPGAAVRAGGGVALKGPATLATHSNGREGTSVQAHDPLLQALATADASGARFFEVFLRRRLQDYFNDPLTSVIDARSCDTPSACGARLVALHQSGHQQFWLDAPTELSRDTLPAPIELGTPARPVLIVSMQPLRLSGDLRVTGLLLASELQVHASDADATTVRGALIVRNKMTHSAGLLQVRFDRTVLGMAGGMPMGLLTPVPGSWRDRFTPY